MYYMIRPNKMNLLVILFISLFNYVYVYDLCAVQENLCSERHVLDNCKVKSMNFDSRDCSQVIFTGNDKLKNNLGDIVLQIQNYSSQLFLNISFSGVKWKKAFIRLSDENNRNQNVCKMYTVQNDRRLELNSDWYDSCLWNTAKKLKAKTYLLEYKVESGDDSMYKKVLFDLPNINFFGDSAPITKRLIFSYIDFTSSYELVLKLQMLPKSYNVSQYRVEIFRERDKKTMLLDVRLLTSQNTKTVLKFDYLTYNEEGYYYFAISMISDKCPDSLCLKTLTSKIYINRKGTPLVIGIVGASFIIPFVLFMFHMWNRKFKHPGIPERVEKIIILFKPSFEKHNDVIATLAKTIKHLTGIEVMLDPVSLAKTKQKNSEKWCCDNLVLATHIIYLAPPCIEDDNCELDYMTYNFLKEETKKSIPEKDIIILSLPYSTKDVPPILVNCIKFELMVDFHKFLNTLQPLAPDFNYENNINCMELMTKIKLAQDETELIEDRDNPEIVVTDQSEQVDEPKEIDVLL